MSDINDWYVMKENDDNNKCESKMKADDIRTYDGYTVRLHFSDDDYTLEEALKDYIKKLAQIRY